MDNFSKKQFEVILKMSYLANRLVSDSDILTEAQMQEFENLQNHLCNVAKTLGYKELTNDGDVSISIEENCQKLIEEYNDFNFWEELKNRLAERDFDKDHKKNGSKPINVKEKIQKTMDFEEQWEEEFENNGLNRINIIK